MNRLVTFSVAAVAAFCSALAGARDVRLTEQLAFVEVMHEGRKVLVERVQDTEHRLSGGFTKTSRKCPPFCIQPMQVAEGVTTVGEVEMFDFMKTRLPAGRGIIVDARTPAWHNKGTIPGSVNIPFTVFEKDADDPDLRAAMKKIRARYREDVNPAWRAVERALGAVGLFGYDQVTDEWDFRMAKDVLLWCNGPWCGQSPRAARALLAKGFPPEKIFYYRGGMQAWQVLGLTVVQPGAGASQVAAR